MLINDLLALAEKIPPVLAGNWAAWMIVGLLLSRWSKREKGTMFVDAPQPRQKSGVRPPSGARVARAPKHAPFAAGDAFGDLEAILEPPSGLHRRPGEMASPVLAERTPALAAPQSLP